MGRSKAISTAQYIVLAVIAVSFLIPIIWVAVASFDPNAGQAIKLPSKPTFSNFVSVLTDFDNLRGFGNGLILAVSQSIIVVTVSLLAAYPLSRYDLSFKKNLMLIIIFMTALPINAVVVPVYRLFVSLDIQDSLISTSLFMSAAKLPYGIWMMKNFMDNVPVSLEESAWIDGASTLVSLKKVIMPLMVPGIFTVFIFIFTGAWGTFFAPFILIQDAAKFPASVRIYQYINSSGLYEYGKLAAYSFVYILPSIVLYALSQNYMSKGFSMGGGDKG